MLSAVLCKSRVAMGHTRHALSLAPWAFLEGVFAAYRLLNG